MGHGMLARRAAFAVLATSLATGLVSLVVRALAPGGWTLFEALTLACFIGTAPWTALCAANGIVGLAIRLMARDPAAFVVPALATAPAEPSLRTAIVVCIRHEDMAAVLAPLGPLLAGLPADARTTLWFLSDSTDAAHAAAEAAAIEAFRNAHPDHAPRIRYRRRTDNAGFKAGNVMDFLDHHAGDAEVMVVLDADSAMTAAAVQRLVAILEAAPRAAIVQPLIVGRPATAAFPRLFQFGMRAGMRVWATGQGWWQGPDGPFWGHNAAIRIKPFRDHARLEALPDGRAILSHDQVEAVRLHAAGWQVWCLPIEDGSMEGSPPALPEFLARDERWSAGNMQYLDLLRLPGLTAMGRWQLLQAILLFAQTPLWIGVLVFATLNAAAGGGAATPSGALFAAMAASWVALYAVKLGGYLEVLASPAQAARYGGRGAFAGGAGAELGFTALFDPISMVNKARFLVGLAFGQRRAGWAAQNRAARGVAWVDAARLLWPHTLFGGAILVMLLATAPAAVPWALPWIAGLLLAIPFCVLTAAPGVSAWLRARGVAAIPEERGTA